MSYHFVANKTAAALLYTVAIKRSIVFKVGVEWFLVANRFVDF